MEKIIFTKDNKKFLQRLKIELKGIFRKGEKIAIKLHMGEEENPNHLKPVFVKSIINVLKSIGTEPFLFDSPVTYTSERNTEEGYLAQCKRIGFSEGEMGVPVIISNSSIEIKGEYKTYQICRHLAEADGVLVLSHFKGHICSGIGGSIKNLGMGALSKESKHEAHEGGKPILDGHCIMCKKCSQICPGHCITYPANEPKFDYMSCFGCSKCIQVCSQKCLKPKVEEFDKLLADSAYAALRTFKKSYFINVLRNITDLCDCCKDNVKTLLPDIGILMGKDIVAIDKASIDMCNEVSNKQVFDEYWNKDSQLQIRTAAGFGMGSTDYEIEKV